MNERRTPYIQVRQSVPKSLKIGLGCLGLLVLLVIAISITIWSYYGSYTTIGRLEPTGQMNIPRVNPKAVQLANGNILACGGRETSRHKSGMQVPCEVYNWREGKFYIVEESPVSAVEASWVALKDGRVLITGGDLIGDNTASAINKTFFYDPNIGRFIPGPDMNYHRKEHTSILLPNGRVLVFGGEGYKKDEIKELKVQLKSEIYDPRTNYFYEIESPAYRYGRDSHVHRFIMPNGDAFILGYRENKKQHGEIFNTTTEKFTKLPENEAFEGRLGKMIGLLPNGKLVISVEGYGENSFYLADPYTGTSEKVTSIAPGRHGSIDNTVTLKNGNVLFVGGQQSGWSAKYADMELYIYKKNKVIKLGRANVVFPRVFQLPNEKVLLFGGYSHVSAELLDLSEEKQ